MGKEKKQGSLGQFIVSLIFAIVVIFTTRILINSVTISDSSGIAVLQGIFLLILLYTALFIQLILHEAGHLLFGLLTGYRFVSFRIANLILIKKDGKFSLKKYSLAGTGGQCLMAAHYREDGKYPYALYNMGGVLLNIITAFICLDISIIVNNGSFAVFFCSSLAFTGFLSALANGIPLKMGIVENDGKNTISLSKSPEARKALYTQLLINENIQNGIRLKDMPEELFAPPSAQGMQNGMIAAMAVFRENRLMDELKFAEAAKFIEVIRYSDWAISDLHKRFLTLDRITCELAGTCDKEKIDSMMTKKVKKFMRSMKNSLSVMRTEYAVALFYENNTAKAEKIADKFEKRTKTHPYAADIECEREIMEFLKQKYYSANSTVSQ